jgi:septum formation inhibitor MinC
LAVEWQAELKGTRGGVEAVVPAHVPDAQVGQALAAALGRAARFLGDASLTVVLPGRRLDATVVEAVTQALRVAPQLRLMGLTTTPSRARPRPARAMALPPLGESPGGALVHRGTLRAGQELRHTGDVVVVGDVHRGAGVVANGDVIVLGRLEGVAHAGALGDEGRMVYAGAFCPLQVRIGARIATGPANAPQPPRGPEWARVEDGRIVVQPWPGPRRTRGGRPRMPKPLS